MVLDAQKGEEQKEKITKELESVGIRLNKEKPQIHIKVMKTGGILFNSAVKLTKIDEKMVKSILAEYKMHNCHISFRGDHDVDELIDVIESNRKYVKCIYVYNKIDTVSIEDVDKLMQDPYNAAISVHMNLGCDILLEKIWDTLGLVRVYTRKKGQPPDFSDPLILTQGRDGICIKSAIMQIHKGLL
jgi:ribosome-interacting GTPase 1